MPFPGGLWWLLCCRQGFTLLRRDYGEAEREADGEAEEEASFELRAQGDRVGPSGTGRQRSRCAVRFGPARGRPAPRLFALHPPRSRCAAPARGSAGPGARPAARATRAEGVRSRAPWRGRRERIRRFPAAAARPRSLPPLARARPPLARGAPGPAGRAALGASLLRGAGIGAAGAGGRDLAAGGCAVAGLVLNSVRLQRLSGGAGAGGDVTRPE